MGESGLATGAQPKARAALKELRREAWSRCVPAQLRFKGRPNRFHPFKKNFFIHFFNCSAHSALFCISSRRTAERLDNQTLYKVSLPPPPRYFQSEPRGRRRKVLVAQVSVKEPVWL